jgi:hypothetical protein
MKDFAHSRGEFAHLKGKEAERKSLLEKLVATIRVRVRMSFSCVVSPDDYAAVDKQYLLSEQFGNPYSFCGRHCVARVRTWGTDNGYPLDEFRYVFEQGAKGRGLLVEVMERDGFPRPDFEGKEISPLQAADFVAWEHTKALDDAQERFRKSLLALNKIPNNWDIYTRERLEYLCQEARFERRSSDQNP